MRAAAWVLALAVGLGACSLTRTSDRGGDAPPQAGIAAPAPARAGTNRSAAIAKAAAVSRSVPLPPGAVPLSAAPVRALRGLHAILEPVDPTLRITRWWSVPTPHAEVAGWYRTHHSEGARVVDGYGPASKRPRPVATIDWSVPADTTGYSPPAVIVTYASTGPDTTALEISVTLAARADRVAATLVPATVTSIDISRIPIDGPDPRTTTTATVTDERRIVALVAAYDRLPGAFQGTQPGPCGSPDRIVYASTLTFHWPGHALRVDPGAPLCGVGMGLTLDGRRLPQTIEDDDPLDTAVAAAM
jgi:hypothetical protein